MAQACPANHPTTSVTGKLSVEACPEYFRWIHEDLRPWKSTGISRFAVESAEGDADFRLVIVNGKAYVEQYRNYTLTGDQNWEKESNGGFKNSNLAYKCTHRYKIYVEGWGWSVSEKYVLACDSMTLLIKPYPHDFFTRSMVPLLHYWPIRPRNKCRDLKFAVEWGNTHPEKAQEIGKAGSNFIHEELKMDFVYDYMFHLLNEYSKLLKFKPAVLPGAVELCLETMDCSADAVL
uniref:Glycosyl transferase CAP10 domain-containing protein n=1 Tax=Vitis vinifera TaxID=29760 RepID=F6I5Z6_VITVI